MVNIKSNCKYSLVVPTSMGIRISPEDNLPMSGAARWFMQATSAETNVLNISASLGERVKCLTCFVKGSPVASFIKNELGRRHIEYEGPELEQGGPWGLRHQFNIADSGWGARGPVVQNDRAGEAGRMLRSEYFDLDGLFNVDGAAILHISGLVAAISHETSQLCAELAVRAAQAGTLVSFDLNYRASFWKGREAELSGVFRQIASLSDILVGNEEDFQLALGIKGPAAGGKDITAKTAAFEGMIESAAAEYPRAKVFATTLRQVISANSHLWGAIVKAPDGMHLAQPREIGVLDRIGGGDAFVGGLLYGALKGMDADKCMQLGWASGALAVSSPLDYATPTGLGQLESIWDGNARIVR